MTALAGMLLTCLVWLDLVVYVVVSLHLLHLLSFLCFSLSLFPLLQTPNLWETPHLHSPLSFS